MGRVAPSPKRGLAPSRKARFSATPEILAGFRREKMESTLKHVVWSLQDQDGEYTSCGRAGIRVQDDRIELAQLAGEALPASLLVPVISAVLGDGWVAEAERLHRQRANPWQVETRTGMSGARKYRLRVLENAEWHNAPIVASLHVSMYGKLNEGLRLWMGDLPPLLAAVLQDYPPASDVFLQVYEPVLRNGYQEPGADSGIQAVLDSLKAMEVMSE